MAVPGNTVEAGQVTFIKLQNGYWKPTYGKPFEGELQHGAPVWQSRHDRPGWYEVDEGWVLVPKGVTTDKNLDKQRQCKTCGRQFHWRTMKASWETVYTDPGALKRAGTSDEAEDIKTGRVYTRKWHTCVSCYAQELGVTENQAKEQLIKNRSEKSTARTAAYEKAKQHVQSTFEFLGVELDGEDLRRAEEACHHGDPKPSDMRKGPAAVSLPEATGKRKRALDPDSNRSKKAQKKLAIRMKIDTLEQIFGPAIDLLRMKDLDERAAVEHAQRLKAWLTGDTSNLDAGIECEKALSRASHSFRAFSDYSDPKEMRRAADYNDRWFASEQGVYNVYYVCRAGGNTPCNTVIQSKAWTRMKDNPLASGQRWYCHCKARYRVAWGTLVEIFRDGVACYCLASLPSPNMQDIKGMMIEQRFKDVKTAKELYEAIPSIEPLAANAFTPIVGRPGMWRLEAMEEMDKRPRFEWNQLYNLPKTEEPTTDPAVIMKDTSMEVTNLEVRDM